MMIKNIVAALCDQLPVLRFFKNISNDKVLSLTKEPEYIVGEVITHIDIDIKKISSHGFIVNSPDYCTKQYQNKDGYLMCVQSKEIETHIHEDEYDMSSMKVFFRGKFC